MNNTNTPLPPKIRLTTTGLLTPAEGQITEHSRPVISIHNQDGSADVLIGNLFHIDAETPEDLLYLSMFKNAELIVEFFAAKEGKKLTPEMIFDFIDATFANLSTYQNVLKEAVKKMQANQEEVAAPISEVEPSPEKKSKSKKKK